MSLPWPETAPPVAAVHAALHRASTTIGIATGMVHAGRSIDLAGLDALAGALCAQVLDLPPAHGAGFRLALAELEARLAALGTAIRARDHVAPAK